MCALAVAGVSSAAPWRRSAFLGSSVAVPAVVRVPESGAAADLTIWDGRAVVSGRRLDPAYAAAFASELDARLRAAFDGADWNVPFRSAEPLRVIATAAYGLSFSDVFSASGQGNPVVALNLAGRAPADAAAEAVRGAAVVVLRALAPSAPSEVVSAAARAISLGRDLTESDREELREIGAAPEHSLDSAGAELFAGEWIRQMASDAGPGFVRAVWTGRVAEGNASLAAFATAFREQGGSPGDALYRALAGLYGTDEVIGDPARLTETDLATGGLNAAAPPARSWRLFTTFPSGTGGWNVAWPEDGARAFAVVHYEDGLPNDIVPFSAGDRKTLPASGVSRIDWVVLGSEEGGALLASPASVLREEEFPMTGLSAEARTEPGEGVVLSWRTASHRDLSGWAILRSEVTEDGRVVRAEPESLPAQLDDPNGASYDFVDTSATPGRYYRYDVWAVTADGAMARAFRATLRAK
ncbi:MAG TPA: hypothetical protein VFS34_09405 [Thermoanaerobaculia bacterium]|nr:hypothetical protein [Thermoanaerobaculia bacterium]